MWQLWGGVQLVSSLTRCHKSRVTTKRLSVVQNQQAASYFSTGCRRPWNLRLTCGVTAEHVTWQDSWAWCPAHTCLTFDLYGSMLLGKQTCSDLMDFLKRFLFLLFPIMNLQDKTEDWWWPLTLTTWGVVSMLPQSHPLIPSSDPKGGTRCLYLLFNWTWADLEDT